MRNNIKMGLAVVLIVGAVFWAVSSVRSSSFIGTDLNVAVGEGTVTVTNSTDAPVNAQITSPGSRTFTVASSIEGAAGTSVRQGTGGASTQLFELVLPPGVSDFTVLRGSRVSFTGTPGSRLEVTVEPLSLNSFRTTLIAAAVVILGALFYLSRTTNHRWLSMLRGKAAANPVAKGAAEVSAAAGQGTEIRAYGDNRAP